MKPRVLCVDDEPLLLRSLGRVLRDRFDVHTAPSGAEALALMDQAGPFAVLVTDLKMPGMDGVELLHEVRRRHPATVCLVMSGQLAGWSERLVPSLAVFQVLRKPVSAPVLQDAIAAAVEASLAAAAGQEPGPDEA